MCALHEELKQHALQKANELQTQGPNGRAYDRVQTYTGVACPQCWVSRGISSDLEVETYGSDTNFYRCPKCGFGGVFPHLDVGGC